MWRTIGQQSTVERLSRGVAEGITHHAYLFLGPKHVGKRTLAIDLACALNCIGDGVPCGACRACIRILDGKHADIHAITLDDVGSAEDLEIEEEGRKRRTRILTEQIEDLQHASTLPPYEGRFKVMLVEHADRMTNEAANRILKVLEEPPPQVVWMLLAENESRMLETVVSRCQRIDVREVPVAQLEGYLLEGYGASPEQAKLLARISRGRSGWALQALADETLLKERAGRLETAIQLLSMTYAARFEVSRELDAMYRRDPRSVIDTLDQWTTWGRDLLLVKTGCAENVGNIDYIHDMNEQAQRLSLEQIRDYIGKLTEARRDLDLNLIARLVFDSLVYTMPRITMPARGPGVQPVVLQDRSETQ